MSALARRRAEAVPWAHRLAWTTAGATLLLIVAGGLVTNTGAGLAVPDWPMTFGHNPFLFPWSKMVGGILIEHGHRLLGALVGLLTLALAVTVWATDRRGSARGLATLAVALVSLQGVLGGLRVVLVKDALAIAHGCLAPAFFALTLVLAGVTSPRWARPVTALAPRAARGLGRLSVAVTAALYAQIVLGALATHQGRVAAHLGGAVVVTVTVVALAARALGGGDEVVARLARLMGVLLGLQLALGLGAYAARFTGLGVPGGPIAVVGLPVAHRAMGAILFGMAAALTLDVWRRRLTGPTGVVRAPGPLVGDVASARGAA